MSRRERSAARWRSRFAVGEATARPADPVMYWAGLVLLVAPLLGGWPLLAPDPLWFVPTLLLSIVGLPISYRLRQRGANTRALVGWVTLAGLIALLLLLSMTLRSHAFQRATFVGGEMVGYTLIIRVIALIVAFRAMTLLTDADLQMAIGFGLSLFLLLGLVAPDWPTIVAFIPFVAAALLLRLRMRRREQLAKANQVLGRSEETDWRQDAGLLARLGVVIAVLAVVLGFALSGLDLHERLVRVNMASPAAIRFAQWIAALTGSRLPEGGEAAMEIADVGGSPSEVPLFSVDAPEGRLWRSAVFNTYDGYRFTNRGVRLVKSLRPLDDGVVPLWTGAPTDTTRLARYRFDRLVGLGAQLYTVHGASAVRAGEVRVNVRTDSSVATVPHIERGEGYTVWLPLTPPANPPPPITEAERARCLRLPDRVPPIVAQMAAEITAGATTPDERIERLTTWLATNKLYTLRPALTPRGQEPTSYFLTEMRAGWCRHFAAALALMGRTVGVPTRVISGYASGDQDEEGRYVVKPKDAHAWVEAWLPGQGWVEYDATSLATEELTGLAALMDRLRRWWAAETQAHGPWRVILSIAGTILAVVLFRLRRRLRRPRWRRRGALRRPRGASRADRLLLALVRTARRLGVDRAPADTEHGLAARVVGQRPWVAAEARELAALIARGRYGRSALRPDEVRAARRLLAALRRRPPSR